MHAAVVLEHDEPVKSAVAAELRCGHLPRDRAGRDAARARQARCRTLRASRSSTSVGIRGLLWPRAAHRVDEPGCRPRWRRACRCVECGMSRALPRRTSASWRLRAPQARAPCPCAHPRDDSDAPAVCCRAGVEKMGAARQLHDRRRRGGAARLHGRARSPRRPLGCARHSRAW